MDNRSESETRRWVTQELEIEFPTNSLRLRFSHVQTSLKFHIFLTLRPHNFSSLHFVYFPKHILRRMYSNTLKLYFAIRKWMFEWFRNVSWHPKEQRNSSTNQITQYICAHYKYPRLSHWPWFLHIFSRKILCLDLDSSACFCLASLTLQITHFVV